MGQGRYFGFWREQQPTQEGRPALCDWLGDAADPASEAVVAYLIRGLTVAAATSLERCLICGEVIGGMAYLSDGHWLWPQGLAHYVAAHQVVLPPPLRHWIMARQGVPFELPEDPLRELDWPTDHTK